MKRLGLIIIALFLFSIISVVALNADDAKQDWIDAKEARLALEEKHQDAKLAYAENPSEKNKEKVVDTSKDLFQGVLDEAEAWLRWKRQEARENDDVSEALKDKIENDVKDNLDTIDELRIDVDKIENPAGAGLVFLKIISKYGELLTDVARNSGYAWIEFANEKVDKLEQYEEKLRAITDDEDLLEKLDIAKDDIETARKKIDIAEKAYDDVKLPGTPFIKFAEGNGYLRQAKRNMLDAYAQLQLVYNEILRSNK